MDENKEKPEDCNCSFPFTEEIAFRHPKSGHHRDCPVHRRWEENQARNQPETASGNSWRKGPLFQDTIVRKQGAV